MLHSKSNVDAGWPYDKGYDLSTEISSLDWIMQEQKTLYCFDSEKFPLRMYVHFSSIKLKNLLYSAVCPEKKLILALFTTFTRWHSEHFDAEDKTDDHIHNQRYYLPSLSFVLFL